MAEARDFGNLLACGQKCCNGGRWKSRVQMFEIGILRWTAKNHRRMRGHKFRFRKTSDFTLHERGKTRYIRSHNIKDRQLQKSFSKHVLIPALQNRILENNSASQKGKGTDHAIKAFRKGLAHAYKVCKGRNFYVVVYDFHNYFGSIRHSKIRETIGEALGDPDAVSFLESYVDIFDGDIGVGIGGEPSQVIAISFPSSIDRMFACNPSVIASGRYMDDGWGIVRTKSEAKQLLADFYKKAEGLGLDVNGERTRAYWMEKDVVTFLKKRTSMTETGKIIMRLTRKNVTSELRRIRKQKEEFDRGEMPWEPILQSFECWCSYARRYNSNKAMLKVAHTFSETFGVPWKDVVRLMNGGRHGKKRDIQGTRKPVRADPCCGTKTWRDFGTEA